MNLNEAVWNYMFKPPTCHPGPASFPIERYDGEFGYELYQGVPRVWAQCQRKRKPIIHSICDGMQPFYRFADLSFARPVYCARLIVGMKSFNQGNYTRQHLPPDFHFRLPPYREMYRWETNFTFAYVFNKKGLPGLPEWAPSGVGNSWQIQMLLNALAMLHQRYDYVVYFRPGAAEVDLRVPEGDSRHDPRFYPDLEMIRRYSPKTLLLHEMVKREGATDRTYLQRMNVAQLLLSVNAEVVVGTQGGLAVLAGQTSRHFLFLCKYGHECTKDVHWWRRYIRNSTVAAFRSEQVLNFYLSRLCVGASCNQSIRVPTAPKRHMSAGWRPRIRSSTVINVTNRRLPPTVRRRRKPPPPPPSPPPPQRLWFFPRGQKA